MAEFDSRYSQTGTASRSQAGVMDEGLRAYMLGVYNYMAAGVALTGVTAYVISALAVTETAAGKALTPLGQALYASPLKWVVMLAPLVFIFLFSMRADRMSSSTAQFGFWAFAAVMGISISSIFLVFTGQSIAQIFFVTAAAFAALSVWGYTTKRDLGPWGSFLFMGVIGIIIAALVNLFLQSSAIQFAISSMAVLIFAGLTAYDTQRIRDEYYHVAGNAEMAAKASIFGAFSLYLNFVNMFMALLQLFGDRE